ncbi:hypothetical protein [Amphiplicatus metriothermophilus]|uniref:Uncharacterized protein n=1 Tax=Amphiplicatus metriothermophilus TaxID=1519374 RepID=A0A239PXM6_9PROT|nr:hypothetical protein [Amphiplicatus metriothermophilus]MBB5519087.1 hypothetical protein [Amphiplicatus metriothermophilus]SNT74783.1 hypothetical protein SAMN06297382_2367 [Amphiplicatus metriothermophilus]
MTPARKRLLLFGALATLAAILAVAAIILLLRREAEERRAAVCLRTDIGVAGLESGSCRPPAAFADFAESPVTDSGGAASVSLSHPTDPRAGAVTVRTCAAWRARRAEGWHALAAADMRRELAFERACGALAALERARAPERTHFRDGALARGDVAAVAGAAPLRIGPAADDAEAGTVAIEAEAPGVWRWSAGGQRVRLQEIAHADFNGDGLGDVLVFLAAAAESGTASAGAVGIVEKTAENAPARFTAM